MDALIYIIRHGESEGNARRDFLGHTDLPITEKGRDQARAAASYLANEGFAPDAVYASPLCRAYETTEIALSAVKAPVPVCLDGLREIYAGEWENRNFDALDIAYPEARSIWREDIGNACPTGGESVRELYERVISTVLSIAKENRGKTVFIGTHATPLRAIEAYAQGLTFDQMAQIPWATNASISVYRSDGEHILPLRYSYDAFQKGACEPDRALRY